MANRPRVYTALDERSDPRTKEDPYLAKLVKYIPAEVIAAYVAAAGATKAASTEGRSQTILWIVTIVLALLTPAWILSMAAEPNKPQPRFQALAGTIAFITWVFALGGPFENVQWYEPLYGTLALILITIVVPIVEKAFVRS